MIECTADTGAWWNLTLAILLLVAAIWGLPRE